MNDFYERNNLVRPLSNATSASEVLDHRSRETILRNTFLAMRSWRAWRGRQLAHWVSVVTGHGSGYSYQICEEMGWNPEMTISAAAKLPDTRAMQREKFLRTLVRLSEESDDADHRIMTWAKRNPRVCASNAPTGEPILFGGRAEPNSSGSRT